MKTSTDDKARVNLKRSTCPLANMLDLIGDKWSLLIVRDMIIFNKQWKRLFHLAGASLLIPATPKYPAGLTGREVEVLRLVAQGFTDAQVAETLIVSVRTVNAHLQSIYSKLGVNTRMAAVHSASKHKLV